MRILSRGAGGAIGARLGPQLIDHGHEVTGPDGSPRNAERLRALGAELIALGQPPARVWHCIAGSS